MASFLCSRLVFSTLCVTACLMIFVYYQDVTRVVANSRQMKMAHSVGMKQNKSQSPLGLKPDVTRSEDNLTQIKNSSSVEKQYKGQQLFEEIEQRQRERQQRLKMHCKRYLKNNTKRILGRREYKNLIVNDKYKVIYCSIPKVACSQWLKVFCDLDNRPNAKNVYINHKRLEGYSNEDRNLRLKTYFKFLFVRDPFERLLSAYMNKFVNDRDLWKIYSFAPFEREMINNFKRLHPNSDEKASFTKFIYYVSGVGFNREPHWASYDSLCHPCEIDYDFIGHFEHMQDEGPYILRQNGMNRVATFPDFVTHNTTAKLLHEYAPIPKEKIVELAKAFEKDFGISSYPFPGSLSGLMPKYVN